MGCILYASDYLSVNLIVEKGGLIIFTHLSDLTILKWTKVLKFLNDVIGFVHLVFSFQSQSIQFKELKK